jgi:hypothetical protein
MIAYCGWLLAACGCLLHVVACCDWVDCRRRELRWLGRTLPLSKLGAIAAVLLDTHHRSTEVSCIGFGLVILLVLIRQSFGLVLIHSLITADTMGSDWFWFCLLLLILVLRAAPSSLSDLLHLRPLHNTTAPLPLCLSVGRDRNSPKPFLDCRTSGRTAKCLGPSFCSV